jgi:hypothetical protein
MSEEMFPYDQWVNEALLKVLARALKQLSNTGPVGEHHFFINIETDHPDVDIPDFLRIQYPKEITLVLQHQFEELVVDKDGFEVILAFGGKKSRLKIPFSAVISFADPSVNFGLQIGIPTASDDVEHLKSKAELNNLDTIDAQDAKKTKKGTEPFYLQLNTSKTEKIKNTVENETSTEKNLTTTDLNGEAQTAEVIALDTFRKK